MYFCHNCNRDLYLEDLCDPVCRRHCGLCGELLRESTSIPRTNFFDGFEEVARIENPELIRRASSENRAVLERFLERIDSLLESRQRIRENVKMPKDEASQIYELRRMFRL